MHHGESSTFLYYLGLADPKHTMDRARALRFAAMYTGEDDLARNWDAELKMMRSPINGSRGPSSEMTALDWVTHRPILARYLSPYQDIPGVDLTDPLAAADWTDDGVFRLILERMNQRMVPGDVPLNLNATSLIANAFMYTGDRKYKTWILEYLDAWRQRTEENQGIMPDNVGPTGKIGERMGGNWWGGYYGWRWPHGAWIILESTLIAGGNGLLMTGDESWLDLHRSQVDLLWSQRKEQEGGVVVPFRYGQPGWFDFRPERSRHHIHLWFLSRNHADKRRLEEHFPDRRDWYQGEPGFGKAGHFWPERWYGYVSGENPEFPDQVLEDTYNCMTRRLDAIDADDWSRVEDWDVHHWQNLNPVVPEGLIQMAMGTPAAIYHGGLLHACVRYFDPQEKRPGLPEGIAALVKAVDEDGIGLELVNTDPLHERTVVVQAGCFGEHKFTAVRSGEGQRTRVHDRAFKATLGPWARADLRIGMDRYKSPPTYTWPDLNS
jgi:hypothetical protein